MIRYALLALLRERADYGYRLKQRFEQRLGDVWRLNIGQVYQALRALERAHLVAELPAEPDAPRARRVFQLTPDGEATLERWVSRASVRPAPTRSEFLIKLLVLGSGRSADALAAIEREEEAAHRHLRQLCARRDQLGRAEPVPTPGEVLSLEAALLQSDAHARWLGACRHYLRTGELPDVDGRSPLRASRREPVSPLRRRSSA